MRCQKLAICHCSVEEELYRSIMSGYEEKQRTLLVENHEMRQCLSNLQQELHKLLHSESSPDSTSDCISPEESQVMYGKLFEPKKIALKKVYVIIV